MNTNDGSGKPDLRLPPVGSDIHSLVPDSFFYDSAAQTLYCQLGDQSSPASHFMEASVRDSVFDGAGKSFITLSGLSFLHSNGTAGGGYPGVVSVDGSGWTIDNCTIQNGDFAGLRMSGDHHIVRSCRILDNGDVGINLSGSDAAHNYGPWLDRPSQQILLTGLVVSGNNYRHFNENWHAGGIKGIPSMRGVTVRDCRVLDNDAAGIWFDTDYGDNVIENNLVVRNHTGITVEINQPGGPDSFGSIVRNNRVAFNTGQGIYISASSGATVANNTCYHNDFGIVVHGMPRSDGGAAFQLRDDIVKDNIVDGKWDDIVLYQGDNAVGNTLDGDFYVINGPGGIKLSVTNVSNYNLSAYDLGTAQQKYGFEKSGESGNPEWISPDTLDFHLRPGSPAAGKGWQVPAN